MTEHHESSPGRLALLAQAGQGVWLDFVERGFLERGELRQLVAQDAVTGVTSNPSLFEKAMGQGHAYDAAMRDALRRTDLSPAELYEAMAVEDIRRAADDLMPVYERLDGRDGYVSLEVSPHLAGDEDGTVDEARRLWAAVDRPNLMVKVPGTPAGVAALRRLTAEAINVNVTLLFAVDAYKAAADAYLCGLEDRIAAGQPIDRIAGVASFFLSRIDTLVDDAIDALPPERAAAWRDLKGKVAIANAKRAHAHYRELVGTDRWRALAGRGARPQRLLWASTGTKNPAYSDVLYVEELIGPDTVNTMPPATLAAFRDHGAVRASLNEGAAEAEAVLARLAEAGFDLDAMTAQLAADGVAQFVTSFDNLLEAVARKREEIRAQLAATG
ncbi:transaldolase [Erythrobacteraceae bacterium CFH 75059]|uniref:transaldolase n=1 Tax=Qipengyuania thermophila TaxID=2509361 RepID=UPI0010217C44|nr:transaldolase [Qipengyuania thermophila]TCD04316.1 transaldolase [Erythrobacteraceae bacterium CFH 75059]